MEGGGTTGSDVTGSGPERKYVLRMPGSGARFFLTIVVVQNVSLRMTGSSMATGCDVTENHVTSKGFSWNVGCAHAQPEVGISPY